MVLRRSNKKQSTPAAPPPGAAVAFDPWNGDAELPQLRAALDAGDREPLAEAYAGADGHRREVLVHQLTLDQPSATCLDRWPEEEPDLPLAHLMRGSQRIGQAWAARGSGQSGTVTQLGWDRFFDGLRAAEGDLHRAAQLDDDGVAWSTLLVSGRGLQLTLDELRARYARAIASTPRLAFAADQLHQSLCGKWFGSYDESLDFARSIAAEAKPGDPRHRLVAASHVEHGITIEDQAERDAFRADAAIADELRTVVAKGIGHKKSGDGVQDRRSLNWTAMGVGYFRQWDDARPLLERIGDAPTVDPWAYFGSAAGQVLLDYRSEAGLPPLA